MSSFNFTSTLPPSNLSVSEPLTLDPSLSAGNSLISSNPTPNIPPLGPPSAPTSTSVFCPDPQAALFIDSLGQRFSLSKQQITDLHGLFRLGVSLSSPLGQADIMARIYSLACQYGSEQRILHAMQSSESAQGNVGDMRALFQELSIRLKDTFHLTKEQKISVRRLCQELIYKHSRTVFKSLHSDVERKMRAKPELNGMENIFGQLAREAKWTSEAKRIASNVRNAFRQEIRDSIIGKKRCSVEQFTTESCLRYRQGMKAGVFEQGYLIHNVILRRFAWENKGILGVDEDEVSESEDSTEIHTPIGKKRKRGSPKGRVAHGDDFWSRVDSWFQERISLWGSDFSGADWKLYIQESLALDNERHNPLKTPVIVGLQISAQDGSMAAHDGPFVGSQNFQAAAARDAGTFDFMSAFQPSG